MKKHQGIVNVSTFLILFLVSVELSGQIFGKYIMEPTPSAMGSTKLTFTLSNPAYVNINGNYETRLIISPYRFGLKELSPVEAGISLRIEDRHNINFSIFNIGNNLYGESSFELGYAVKIANKIIIGSAVDFNIMKIENFANYNMLRLHIGSKLLLTEDFSAGFSLLNLNKASYGSDSIYVWQSAIIGISHKLSENFIFDADAIIDITRKTGFSIGFLYEIHDNLDLRIATRTEPAFYEIGIKLKNIYGFDLVLMSQYNSILGISPVLGLTTNY